METETSTNLISVDLPLSFVHGLLALTHLMDNRVIASLRLALEDHQSVTTPQESVPGSKRASPVPHNTELSAEILGQRVLGTNLPDLFARCVDTIHDLDPSAIERLAGKKTHARRYVARRSEDIHFRSPHLKAMRTKSGWWVSANVGEQQVTKAMRLLAEAANLMFGVDFIFPSAPLPKLQGS